MKRHFKHLFLLMLLALSWGTAAAQKQEHQAPYELDLNTTVTTSGAFKLAPGWQRLVDSGLGGYYSYNRNNGYGSTGWLYCTLQGEGVNDLLVTPELTGNVNMLVKVYNKSYVEQASIRFFVINQDGDGNLEIGDELESVLEFVTEPAEPADPALSSTDFMRVSLAQPLARPTMIGIRMEYVGIDNFHADEADLTLMPGLSFYSASLTTTKPEVTAEGKYTLRFNLRVRNSGEIDLNPGDPGYEVELYSVSKDELLATFPMEQVLTVGTTGTTFSVDIEMNYEDYPDEESFYVQENITGTQYNVSYKSTPVPYEFIFELANGNTTLESGDEVNFGMVQAQKSITLTAYNDGTAPVTINSMTTTNGFTVEGIADGTILAGKQEKNFTVTSPADGVGEVSGRLTVNYGDNKRKTINLKALMMDESKWFEDFQGGQMPVNMVVTTSGYSYWGIYNDSNGSNNKVLRTSSYNEDMISSPLLEMAEGESISFDAARYSYNATLKVYWSTDRQNWNLVQTIGTSTDLDEQWQLPTTNSVWRTFTVTGFPAGRIYIGFGASYIVLDNLYGGDLVTIDHDMQVVSSTLPEEGTVNNALTAAATFKNLNTKAEAADSYAVRLYVDGQAVAEAETANLEPNAQQAFNFSYTPHKAGEFQTYIAFETEDYELKTPEVTLVVGEEIVNQEVVAGNPTSTTTYAPVWVNYEFSESEIIYTADQLQISKGSKITQIVYRGYSTANGSVTSHVQAWIENTEDSKVYNSDGIKATTEMTQILDADVTFNRVGSSSNKVDILVIQLAEPFIYDGKNLRLSFHAESENYKQVYFEAQSLSGQCIYRGVSKLSQLSTKNPSNCSYLPVAHISVEKDPTVLSGTVTFKADGSPVEGQNVTLTSGNVLYEATTDADGQYSMTVVQDDLTYQMRVDREDYNPFIKEISFTEGSQVIDVALEVSKGLVVESITVPTDAIANNQATVTVKASNYSAKDVPANYTARLYNANGDMLAEAAPVVIAAGQQHDFDFNFVALGNAPIEVYAVFENDTFTAESDHATFTPAEEKAEEEIVAGTPEGVSYDTPINIYKYSTGSWSQTIYTPQQLGLQPGDRISHITYKGYNTGNAVSATVRLFLQNTRDAEGIIEGTDDMVKAYDATATFLRSGSSSNHIVMLDMELDKPFEYTGDNLRVWVQHLNANDYSPTGYFEVENTGVSNISTDGINWEERSVTPVMYLTITNAKVMTGTVTDEHGSAVAGAEVKLSCDEAAYQIMTDAQGQYRLEVAQPQHTFTLTISAEGYQTLTTENVSLRDYETSNDAVMSFEVRTFAGGETYTLCLPIALSESQVEAAGQLFALSGMDADGNIVFDRVSKTEAYVPYLYIAQDGSNIFDGMDSWTIDTEANTSVTCGEVTFVGTMSRQEIFAETGKTYYGYRAGDGKFGSFTHAFVSPFRAYLYVEGYGTNSRMAILNGEVTTGISEHQLPAMPTGLYYDLQGRQVKPSTNTHRPALLIKNGKKVIVK